MVESQGHGVGAIADGMSVPAIRLLDVDPELGEDLEPSQFAPASQHAVARVRRFERGRWRVGPGNFDGAGALGVMLIQGVLARKVTVGERTCAELLGPGDVTQPWLQAGPDASICTEVNWQIVQDLQVAILDHAFAVRVARWPEISAAIARRLTLRVHWLAFHLSVCHVRRVDDRLLLVMWHFADRWGKVTPEGVEIPLPLTHQLLALVVGAHRPSVSLALGNLTDAGRIERRSRSRWLLHGSPPAELSEVHEHASRAERPLPEVLEATPATASVSRDRAGSPRSRRPPESTKTRRA